MPNEKGERCLSTLLRFVPEPNFPRAETRSASSFWPVNMADKIFAPHFAGEFLRELYNPGAVHTVILDARRRDIKRQSERVGRRVDFCYSSVEYV